MYGMVGTNRGGIETFLKKMISFMSSDIVFDYVIEETECIHEKDIKDRGGKIYYITGRKKNPVKNLRDNKRLLRSKRNEIKVVYFNLSSLSWIAPVIIASMYGYRICVHSHNAQFVAANSSFIYRVVNRINKYIISKMKITRLTCSKPATEFMFGNAKNVEMIYNAIDTSVFRFDEKVRCKIRKEYGLEECFVLGFTGRLSDEKNPLFLPEIMKDTIKLIPNCKMLVVGDGPLRESLVRLIDEYRLNDRVILTGNVTNVNELMQAMDVFILPSKHEGLPYVIVEAQTAGLPCVISDVITHEVDVTGRVFYKSIELGAESWAKEIERIYTNEQTDRSCCGDLMSRSVFNINKEAGHLESILKGE